MDPASAAIIALLVGALLYQNRQHGKNLIEQREADVRTIAELAVRVVRPQAPARPSRRTEPSEPKAKTGNAHMVGVVRQPGSTDGDKPETE